jgi:hypothetical protein
MPGVPVDLPRALRYAQISAAARVSGASAHVAAMRLSGIEGGESQDPVRAALGILTAATEGLVSAQSQMGGLFAEGRGVTQSWSRAASWLEKASVQGDPRAAV